MRFNYSFYAMLYRYNINIFFKCMCTCRDACIFASLLGKRKIQGFPPNGA